MTKLVMNIAGYSFLFLGLIGLVLPVLQGILFLTIGLILLSRSAPWAQNLLQKLKTKHPKLEAPVAKAEGIAERIEQRFANMIGRI